MIAPDTSPFWYFLQVGHFILIPTFSGTQIGCKTWATYITYRLYKNCLKWDLPLAVLYLECCYILSGKTLYWHSNQYKRMLSVEWLLGHLLHTRFEKCQMWLCPTLNFASSNLKATEQHFYSQQIKYRGEQHSFTILVYVVLWAHSRWDLNQGCHSIHGYH
jgi:hypothetical protein